MGSTVILCGCEMGLTFMGRLVEGVSEQGAEENI
jgi:hypothetical protein